MLSKFRVVSFDWVKDLKYPELPRSDEFQLD
jgi:hypothetical protein